MLHATLHGKLDETTPEPQRLEDALTSTVFGTLLCVDAWDLLSAWLLMRPAQGGREKTEPTLECWFWTLVADVGPRTPGRVAQGARVADGRVCGAPAAPEVAEGYGPLELVVAHAPELGPVVEKLRGGGPEVAALRTRLQLDHHDLASAPEPKQIGRPRREARLPADHHQRTVDSKFLDWKEVGVHLERLLKFLLWCLCLLENWRRLVLPDKSDLSSHACTLTPAAFNRPSPNQGMPNGRTGLLIDSCPGGDTWKGAAHGDREGAHPRAGVFDLKPGITDAQLARSLGKRHQHVNAQAHELERAGWLRRRPGPDGNIGNYPTATADLTPWALSVRPSQATVVPDHAGPKTQQDTAGLEAHLHEYLSHRAAGARYASFDYCFNYFQTYREQGRLPDLLRADTIQLSCLQLGIYLASWGMFRGAADLLQRSARHLVPLIEIIEPPPVWWTP